MKNPLILNYLIYRENKIMTFKGRVLCFERLLMYFTGDS